MKLLFLGAGSGLVSDENNFQSNMMLLADNGKKLLSSFAGIIIRILPFFIKLLYIFLSAVI